MASSGNFPLWSPLIKDSGSLSQGNTRFTGATNNRGAMTSFAIPSGTKFYVELLVKQANYYNIIFGIANPEFNVGINDESDASLNGFIFSGYNNNDWRTNPLVNGSRQGWNLLSDDTTSLRVMALTINRVDNEIKCYLDNTLITNGTISISATETYHLVCAFAGGANANIHMNINGGHDSTGAGDFSAGGNADENGFGDFQNSPPSGFLAPSSANLPISDDIDPAQTDDNIPQKQFNVLTYTGNGGTNAITGLGFQPDLVWCKIRSQASNGALVDSSRGTNKVLFSSVTNADATSADISSFDSDGFTLTGTGTYDPNFNQNTDTYVAWCWRANGGTTASNSDGSITSTVQANTKAGFSIVTYTGNGSGGATFGHGLSAKPSFVIIKNRDATQKWGVWHQSMTQDDNKILFLNTDAALTTEGTQRWDVSAISSSVFGLGSHPEINGSSADYVSYIWHDVEGFQKFGTFVGNGSTDGPFIYTGFRPRMLFIKRTDSAASWYVLDTARDTNNPVTTLLAWDLSTYESDIGSANKFDVLSNGLKIRTSGNGLNGSGGTFVYGAWGDVPFKYNNTF
jgi:hypothetical protein